MNFKIQIECKTTETPDNPHTPILEWRDMRPTGGIAYVFDTYETAQDCARKCYPDNLYNVRIVDVTA